jgi:hypothetical protein
MNIVMGADAEPSACDLPIVSIARKAKMRDGYGDGG